MKNNILKRVLCALLGIFLMLTPILFVACETDDQTSELEKQKAAYAALEESLKALTDKNAADKAALEGKIDAIQAELDALEETHAADKAALEGKIDAIQVELDALEETHAADKAALEKTVADNKAAAEAELKALADKHAADKAALEGKIDAIQAELDALEETHAADKAELLAQNEAIQAELAALEEKYADEFAKTKEHYKLLIGQQLFATQALFDGFTQDGSVASLVVPYETESLAMELLVTVNPLSSWVLAADMNCTQIIESKVATLAVGDNLYYVKVTSDSGSVEVYTVKVVRKAEDGTIPEPQTIKIGLSAPLTGAAAVYGTAVANSAQMAIDEINAAGGLNGLMLELNVMDDQHDSVKAINNYNALMGWGMQVSLGCVTTRPALEFANLAKRDNLFFMTPSASADVVREGANAYQMCFADAKQGKAVAEYVSGLGYSKIGIFYQSDDEYSCGIYSEFVANLDANITTVVSSFTTYTSSDFIMQINTLRDCELIFMPIYYTPAAMFMAQAEGGPSDIQVYLGCDGFDGIDNACDITTISQEIRMLGCFDANATTGPARTFIDKYVACYGAETLNQFGASAYDTVYAIFGAMQSAVAAGAEINAATTASDLCEILKAQLSGGYTLTNAVTSADGIVKWTADGFVDKKAIILTLN